MTGWISTACFRPRTDRAARPAAAVVVIVVMAGVIVYLLQSRGAEPAPQEEREQRPVLVTSENVEEVLEELERQEAAAAVAPGYYTVKMPTTWHFTSGSEPSYDAVVENVEANTNDVYFDLVMADDESVVLYESPVLPRGSRLRGITLDQALEAGTYETVMTYYLIDEDQNVLSTVRVTVKLVVEQ